MLILVYGLHIGFVVAIILFIVALIEKDKQKKKTQQISQKPTSAQATTAKPYSAKTNSESPIAEQSAPALVHSGLHNVIQNFVDVCANGAESGTIANQASIAPVKIASPNEPEPPLEA